MLFKNSFYCMIIITFVCYLFSLISKKKIMEGFDELSFKSYVLFVPKRRKSVKKTMKLLGLKPIYIQGPNKELLNLKKLTEKGIIREDWYQYSMQNIKKKNIKILNTGRVACHLGHLNIMKKFLQTNNKYALIFEDDIYIEPSQSIVIEYQITHILENIPIDAQVVYLSYCYELCSLTTKYNELFSNAVRPLCRHMYIVSREGAKIILDKTIPMYNSGDRMMGSLITKGILKGYLVNSEYLNIYQNRQPNGIFKTNLENYNPHMLCSRKYQKKK